MAVGERVARNALVKNVDETGMRIEGETRYPRVKSAEAPAAFGIGVSRKHLLPA